MFDVSFSELVLILVVGLLVFGPEKLPEVIRTAGMWIAKIKRTFTQMRTEIEREMGVDELKRDLHNNTIMQNLRDVQNDLQRTQQELQRLPYDVSDVVQRANSPASINSPDSTTGQENPNADPTIYFDPNTSTKAHTPALTANESPIAEENSSERKTTADNYSAQK